MYFTTQPAYCLLLVEDDMSEHVCSLPAPVTGKSKTKAKEGTLVSGSGSVQCVVRIRFNQIKNRGYLVHPAQTSNHSVMNPVGMLVSHVL